MQWIAERAWQWYQSQSWLCGFNYNPSTSTNTTKFWQKETFDLPTIDRELDLAEQMGLNSCRVFIQYLVWEGDPKGLLERIDKFVTVAAKHHISTTFCLFYDCAFGMKEPYLGPQDKNIPGVHNSNWTPSPGHLRVIDRTVWPRLESYVKSIISTFASDSRILLWDLYNEPGNSGMKDQSVPLLKSSFEWAREAQTTQPLTVLSGLGSQRQN